MKWLMVALLAVVCVTGCKSLGPIEFCLTHEKYGQVCVGRRPDGTLFVRGEYTEAQTKEITDWAKKIIGGDEK